MMELIVISSPQSLVNEASIINQLFDAGLTCFHLRKPGWDADQFKELLMQIQPVHHAKIAFHQEHQLAREFRSRRLHFPEEQRMETNASVFQDQKQQGFTLSTSIHDLKESNRLQFFDYVFFSPVFNSISKPGYLSNTTDGFRISQTNPGPKIIALSGIDESNVNKIAEMGFDGAAVLGSIWNRPELAVSAFLNLKRKLILT